MPDCVMVKRDVSMNLSGISSPSPPLSSLPLYLHTSTAPSNKPGSWDRTSDASLSTAAYAAVAAAEDGEG